MKFNLHFFSGHQETATSLLDAQSSEEEGEAGRETAMHKPVMLKEVLSMLKLKSGKVVVDATVGLGGHSAAICEHIAPHGRLIAIDKDEEALAMAQDNLNPFAKRCFFVHDDFRNLGKILAKCELKGVDAFLFDLGVSSYQMDNPARGFSIKAEGPLDMRMDRKNFISAYDLLNALTEEEISSVLWRFGQERFSHRIAQAIVTARHRAPISSTRQLADLVVKALPYKARFHHRIHPATRTFQALRIAVNRELDALEEGLKEAVLHLNKGGRICVISFHSLEDKIVKENFRTWARTGRFKLVFKKILTPGEAELKENPRARSAKMRVIERVK